MTIKLLGNETAVDYWWSSAEYCLYTRFQAVASGNMVEFKIYSATNGYVKYALYADNAGAVGNLITGIETGQAVALGWNTLTITSSAITSGTYYWLATIQSAANLIGSDTAGGTTKYKLESGNYATWSWPSPGAPGYSNSASELIAAGYGNPPSPTVTTAAASSIGATTATLNGEVTAVNDTSITDRGFVWDTSSRSDPGNVAPASSGYANNWTESGSFGTGTFNYGSGTFLSGTTYYVRACAKNDAGNWSYGNEVSFLTKPASPTVTTAAASSVGATTATLNGEVTAINDTSITDRGFVWDTLSHGDPGNVAPASSGYASNWTESGSFGAGTFNYGSGTFLSGTTYYVRACAKNDAGNWSYGNEVSFLTKPAAPTNVSATDGTYTTKVTITWTKSTGATGYKVYEGSDLLDTLGDVATYDDTAAPAPTITPGTASASDGTDCDVDLNLAGESASNGSSRTYKVVAFNATGDSADSNTNAGYRGTTALTYQWQRSAADSDADYSNITGATTDPYADTGAPQDGSGRYYKCVVSMSGAISQTSTADRGYRIAEPPHYILKGEYGTNLRPNFVVALGKDDDNNPLYGDASDEVQIGLGGYRFRILSAANITESMQDVADGLILKIKREQQLSNIVTPPNCGLEQWDVVSVLDEICGIERDYRVAGYDFTYNGIDGKYEHTVYLIDV